mgnify:CR=1 FL=1
MAAWNMALRHKGGRNVTKGWRSSAWVKATTNRHARRAVKVQLRADTEDVADVRKQRTGYCW